MRLSKSTFRVKGPPRGYFMELTKTILVVLLRNVTRAEEYFKRMGVRMVSISCYINGFIGEPVKEQEWLNDKV